eukprot:4721790-Alexandrium_andersonii.AAC.1
MALARRAALRAATLESLGLPRGGQRVLRLRGERLAACRARRRLHLRRARRGPGLGPARRGGALRAQGRWGP